MDGWPHLNASVVWGHVNMPVPAVGKSRKATMGIKTRWTVLATSLNELYFVICRGLQMYQDRRAPGGCPVGAVAAGVRTQRRLPVPRGLDRRPSHLAALCWERGRLGGRWWRVIVSSSFSCPCPVGHLVRCSRHNMFSYSTLSCHSPFTRMSCFTQSIHLIYMFVLSFLIYLMFVMCILPLFYLNKLCIIYAQKKT